MFRLGTYRCKQFEDDKWIELHGNDGPIFCTFCGKEAKNRRWLRSHWNSTHHREGVRLNQNKMRQCPVAGCLFKQEKRRGALLAHLRNRSTHDVVALLDAGVDAYKIRQRDLSEYEKYQIINWLHRRKYIDLHSVHAAPNKPCLEKQELKL